MISNVLLNGLNYILSNGGRQLTIKYYTSTTGSIYDEADSLIQSGNTIWTSGAMFCSDPNNAEDALLLEQGKIGINDIRVYISGGLVLSPMNGSALQTKITVGSATIMSGLDAYSIIPIGAQSEEVNGIPIYKRVFLRRLTTGSLIGEV